MRGLQMVPARASKQAGALRRTRGWLGDEVR